jgi:hypothetical protein
VPTFEQGMEGLRELGAIRTDDVHMRRQILIEFHVVLD